MTAAKARRIGWAILAALAAGAAAGGWLLFRRPSERVRGLAADIASEVMLLDRQLVAQRRSKRFGEMIDMVYPTLARLTPEFDDEGRLSRVWLPDLTAVAVSQDDLASYFRRRRSGCGYLAAAGLSKDFTARLTPWECENLGRKLAVYDLTAERLPKVRRPDLRFRGTLPAQFFAGDVFSWAMIRRYVRRQARERGGAEGSDWGPADGARLGPLWERLLERHGRALWLKAVGEMGPEDIWVTGAAMAKALEDAFPRRREAGAVLFFPAGRRALLCPPQAAEIILLGRGPWELLGRALDREAQAAFAAQGPPGPPPRGPGLVPLSPHAAEHLVEMLSVMAAASLKEGAGGAELWDGAFRSSGPGERARPLFREVMPRESGLDLMGRGAPFIDELAEEMPGGAAVLDYDEDGLPDLFLCDFDQARLYRNGGGLRFEDATMAAGLRGVSCRNGASSADYDNDGRPDLLALHDGGGRDRLLRNRGGSFTEATAEAGISTAPSQSVSAAWLDYDRDGRLDLYLVEYGDLIFERLQPGFGDAKNGLPNRLYRGLGPDEEGRWRFEDAAARAGVADTGWGLAAAAFDYDEDGWPDLFLGNDFGRSVLYRNKGGAFEDLTRRAGIDSIGNNMGVSVADFDRDGHLDLFLTYIGDHRPATRYIFPASHPVVRTETIDPSYLQRNNLYRNRGDGAFEEVSAGRVEGTATGWGWDGLFLDSGNSGWDDLFLVNGWWPYRLFYGGETNVFWRYDPGRRRYEDSSEGSGLDFPGESRVAVWADFDRDGCLDVVVTGFHRPRLFAGRCPRSRHWLELRLEGRRSNRDGIGARVRVTAGGHAQTAELGHQGGGYQSSLQRVLRFGLGGNARADAVDILWPSGVRQSLGPTQADRLVVVKEPL